MEKARARLVYFWRDMPPDSAEILSALISLAFAVVLLYLGPRAWGLGEAAYFYAALAGIACAAKLVGTTTETGWLRIAGCLLGVIFWCTVVVVVWVAAAPSVTFLAYIALILANLWIVKQVVKGGH